VKDHQKIKSEFLGISYYHASVKLLRSILFSFLQETGKDICFRCNKKIDTIKEFSIEHKKPWLNVSIELFYDLSNVAFSHRICNSSMTSNRICEFGKNWCAMCRKCLPPEMFSRRNSRTTQKRGYCKKCRNERKKAGKSY
jgi:hypothetical protein